MGVAKGRIGEEQRLEAADPAREVVGPSARNCWRKPGGGGDAASNRGAAGSGAAA